MQPSSPHVAAAQKRAAKTSQSNSRNASSSSPDAVAGVSFEHKLKHGLQLCWTFPSHRDTGRGQACVQGGPCSGAAAVPRVVELIGCDERRWGWDSCVRPRAAKKRCCTPQSDTKTTIKTKIEMAILCQSMSPNINPDPTFSDNSYYGDPSRRSTCILGTSCSSNAPQIFHFSPLSNPRLGW